MEDCELWPCVPNSRNWKDEKTTAAAERGGRNTILVNGVHFGPQEKVEKHELIIVHCGCCTSSQESPFPPTLASRCVCVCVCAGSITPCVCPKRAIFDMLPRRHQIDAACPSKRPIREALIRLGEQLCFCQSSPVQSSRSSCC